MRQNTVNGGFAGLSTVGKGAMQPLEGGQGRAVTFCRDRPQRHRGEAVFHCPRLCLLLPGVVTPIPEAIPLSLFKAVPLTEAMFLLSEAMLLTV